MATVADHRGTETAAQTRLSQLMTFWPSRMKIGSMLNAPNQMLRATPDCKNLNDWQFKHIACIVRSGTPKAVVTRSAAPKTDATIILTIGPARETMPLDFRSIPPAK